MTPTFSSIKINNWRQFSKIDINFHEKLTIITGVNGSGKSTILRILSQHFGIENVVLATPGGEGSAGPLFLSGLFGRPDVNQNSMKWEEEEREIEEENQEDVEEIGNILYSNGQTSALAIRFDGTLSYHVDIPSRQNIRGLFIGSHWPLSPYRRISHIPTDFSNIEQHNGKYKQVLQTKYIHGQSDISTIYVIKEAIIAMAIFGSGNEHVQPDPMIEAHFKEFKEILRKILPTSIGFQDISIRMPDVVIVTKSGDFIVDAASGGLTTLIELAWQMFVASRDGTNFVVIVDEPENHLHPAMQRTILTSLLDIFPEAQFIVATHSPFIVSSVKNSSVYVLDYEEKIVDGKPARYVNSLLLNNFAKGGTASEILRTVLGVPVTMPLWAENELEVITRNFDARQLDDALIAELRSRLQHAGLSEFYPEALSRIVTAR
ncbi:AAA family ATPase [Mycobacterium sp. KBS0706]|uniref:AAA family ATPase n=1 Tax=Mycobacterium sp. KBS0706 TaxID=2578109 RepID=UPI00110FB02F|nr:AAA family ATPase [Mycobacterium sp. KBS0706]TSD89171.1 AAA family ATPase [Mycobacterium sp. KBS0706]